MANDKTIPHSNDVLRYFLVPAQPPPARPSQLFLALHLADPGESGGAFNEVAPNIGYGRQTIVFSIESGGTTSNSSNPKFGPVSSPWGNCTHFSVTKASGQGGDDLIYRGALETPILANEIGKSYEVPVGAIIIGEE